MNDRRRRTWLLKPAKQQYEKSKNIGFNMRRGYYVKPKENIYATAFFK